MQEYSFLFDCSPRAFIIVETTENKVVYYNHTARELYENQEKQLVLSEMFRLTPDFFEETLSDYKKMFQLEDTIKICKNIYTVKANGERLLVDLTMSFIDPQQTRLILECTLKEDSQEELIFEMLNNSKSAMFLSNFDTDFSILHGNKAFYDIFGDSEKSFQKSFKNSFAATLVDVEKKEFVRDVVTTMHGSSPFNRNIQVTALDGSKKWFHLNLEHQFVSEGKKAYRGILFPIHTPVIQTKAQEDYARYFQAIQTLSGGTLFFVNTKTMTSTHHSTFMKDSGFLSRIDNFPYCALDMFHPDDVDEFKEYVEKILKGSTKPFDVRIELEKNEYRWVRMFSYPIYDENKTVAELVVKVTNVDEEKQGLHKHAFDPVTKALRQEVLQEQVELLLAEAEDQSSHALMFLDLDNFKAISDQFGDTFSDILLAELGARMKKEIRGDDVLGRVGEDQFVLFLKNVSNLEILLTKADEIRSSITEPFSDGDTEHVVTGSIGISVYPLHGKDYSSLYKKAEKALTRSKNRGKNMATIYN